MGNRPGTAARSEPESSRAVVVRSGAVAGRLLSVNVGGPRDVEWEGRTVTTAIWKAPVAGARMVRRINLEGDAQADRAAHGGEHRAVFVYQIGSYRYWERELGRDDFTYGQFGENFTVDGLADDEVCIGDRYRVGTALFEVTQPRVTCFRVGIRMADPRMPSLLVARHRPGFYLRVLEEGLVQAGDEITFVSAGPERLTVADIDALLYLPHRSQRMLRRALNVPALSDGWKGSFRELLDRGEDTAGDSGVTAWPGFAPLTVTAITPESDTILSVTLVPAGGGAGAAAALAPAGGGAGAAALAPAGGGTGSAASFSPGQYLTVRLPVHGPEQPPIIRSYSLSGAAGADGYRISVKREPDGAGSGFIHERLRVGDTLEAAAPRGSFTLRPGDRPVVLVSAGVGATPVLAMLHALAVAHTRREVWWVHGARNRRELAFAAEVDQLLEALPDAHRIVSFSRPDAGCGVGSGFDAVGRITGETLASASIPIDADYYLCGPVAFMDSLSAALTARGTLPERVATEVFGSPAVITVPGLNRGAVAPHQPDGAPGSGPPVTFSRSDLSVSWDSSHGNLLELAEACDVPVSFGCRNGVCHYCETGLLDGEVSYGTEPLERPGEDRVLLCCAQPAGPVVLEL